MNYSFTQRVSDIIGFSKEEANRLGNDYIGVEHLLLGIIRDREGKAVQIMERLNLNLDIIKKQIEDELRNKPSSPDINANDIEFDKKASKILKLSILEAKMLKSQQTGTEHILLAIMKENENEGAGYLAQNNITYQDIINIMYPNAEQIPQNGLDFSEEEDEDDDGINRRQFNDNDNSLSNFNDDSRQSTASNTQHTNHDTPVLDSFGTNLNDLAAQGLLDPVIGRNKEIDRLAQILSRRKKNNPILIGEPGVGKSAIIEGLALRITERKVPRILFEKKIVSLDLTTVLSGTKYRGQFEERIKAILNELKNNPDIVLFIDEIHNIVGAGASTGSMDAANMLKPVLARGDIQCIGATTLKEFRQHIEKDGALERRFQKVMVEPTTPEETLKILQNIRDKYEDFHKVVYTDEALQACVDLTERYITNRCFPDKAIDAMDEAGSHIHFTNIKISPEIEEQEQKLEVARKSKNEAVGSQNYELAASFRDQERILAEELQMMKHDWEKKCLANRETVNQEHIANVVSMMSGVPIQRIKQSEGIKLKMLDNLLKERIIAQDKAVDALVKAICRSRVGLKDPNRPIGTFLFLGPTGVGKTQLAKELAKQMFGSTDALIRVDMSEYMDRFAASKLIGAPPGYVGYEEGGLLTEKVRRNPYSIVLLDEIEKAHADVCNILLQIMDDGRLTDSYGRTVDFKNTVIIMTSNIGTKQLKDFGNKIGFIPADDKQNQTHKNDIITKALNKSFAPEFINRIDEIIAFDPLERDALSRIADIELSYLCERLEKAGYKLTITPEAKEFITSNSYNKEFGARPLKRAIQTYLEDKLAELVLEDKIHEGSCIKVMFDDNKNDLIITPDE